jgi:hypothetical protein
VQTQPELIGQEAMVAEAIHVQVGLEFLVAILALAPLHVVLVGGLRQDEWCRAGW